MKKVLYLEDSLLDSALVESLLRAKLPEVDVRVVPDLDAFKSALETEKFFAVLCDNSVVDGDALTSVKLAKKTQPAVPVIVVSGHTDENRASGALNEGAFDYVSKTELWRLTFILSRLSSGRPLSANAPPPADAILNAFASTQFTSNDLLIRTIQQLSMARSINEVAEVVRTAARELVGADGATFVLLENGQCYYADEDAIEPLWKGGRFPTEKCISGWVMTNRQQVAIPDIYVDERVPHDVYRPTFVKSLVMTPVRKESPLAAIGTYWASEHIASSEELEHLQVLADSTSLAIENVNLLNELERRVFDRTAQLRVINAELASFAEAVSHDLRSPLAGMATLLELALEKDGDSRKEMEVAVAELHRLVDVVNDLLRLSKLTTTELQRTTINFSALCRDVLERQVGNYKHAINCTIADGIFVEADAGLLTAALENLISNACKYSSKVADPAVEIGVKRDYKGNKQVLFVRDNGAGFDMESASDLFGVFKRFHLASEFPGTGVGLATVRRIIGKHGGEIWAQSSPGYGAVFYFTLG
jgi:signal transduction histidine kinase/CheY-like chemotaxis protein